MVQAEVIKRCERCDCIITRFNEYCKSSDSCFVCRDEEWEMAMADSLDGDPESIKWLKEFEKVVRELKETPYQNNPNIQRIHEEEDLTDDML